MDENVRLEIKVVSNGFLVEHYGIEDRKGKRWVFETSQGLSEFILKWGEDHSE